MICFNRLVTILEGLTPKKEEVSFLAVPHFFIRARKLLSFIAAVLHSNIFFSPTAVDAQLDDVGLSFVKNSISAIETRGEL